MNLFGANHVLFVILSKCDSLSYLNVFRNSKCQLYSYPVQPKIEIYFFNKAHLLKRGLQHLRRTLGFWLSNFFYFD